MDDPANNLERIRAALQSVSDAVNRPAEAIRALNNSRLQEMAEASARAGTRLEESIRPAREAARRFAELDALTAAAGQRMATLMEAVPKLPEPELMNIRVVRSPETVWLEAVVEATNANTAVTEAQTAILKTQERRLDGLQELMQAILSEQRTTTRITLATLAVAIIAALLALVGILAGM